MTSSNDGFQADIEPLNHVPSLAQWISAPKRLLIGGEAVDAVGGHTFATYDPSTGNRLTEVAEAREPDIDRAVKSSREALNGAWKKMLPEDRSRLLLNLANLMQEHSEELAVLESVDGGKILEVARAADVPLSIDHFRYFAGWPERIVGETIPANFPDSLVYTRKEPIGVVGAIVPWNFPLLQVAWKLGPALAAGCTVVIKPAEQTPLSALRFGELALEAGFPPGVINICPGYGDPAGRALVDHPDVNKIAFTGSMPVAQEIVRRSATTLKHVSLELGGKSPNIIFPDANIDDALAAATDAIFFNSGQVCSAGSRLMVHEDVYDEVVGGITENARGLRMGKGYEADTTLGPLISQDQVDRVMGFIEQGVDQGADVVAGGNRATNDLKNGYFVEPTVLSNVTDTSPVYSEEIFGPVLVVEPFSTVEEVATKMNLTSYGLAAAVWTRDIGVAHSLADRVEAGTVWLNCYSWFSAAVPWGGFKQSGWGRDAGREGLEKYLQTKSVFTNLAC